MKVKKILVLLFIIIMIFGAFYLLYWTKIPHYTTGTYELVFNPDRIVLQPGQQYSVRLEYRVLSGTPSTITVTLESSSSAIIVSPITLTLSPGESAIITVSTTASASPGTYNVYAKSDDVIGTLAVSISQNIGTQTQVLEYREQPIAWKIYSGTLVEAYQYVPNPPYGLQLIYRGKIRLGSSVELWLKLYPKNGDYWIGDILIEVRADKYLWFDETIQQYEIDNIYIDGKTWINTGITFSPPSTTGGWLPGSIRQYFFKIYYRDEHGNWVLLYDPNDPSTRPCIEVEG